MSSEARLGLRPLLSSMTASAAELASTGIGATIQHDDLHDANVLRSGTRTVVFDWGDASLTHPFLSLGVLLRAAAVRAEDTPDEAIARVMGFLHALVPGATGEWIDLPRPETARGMAVGLSALIAVAGPAR